MNKKFIRFQTGNNIILDIDHEVIHHRGPNLIQTLRILKEPST